MYLSGRGSPQRNGRDCVLFDNSTSYAEPCVGKKSFHLWSARKDRQQSCGIPHELNIPSHKYCRARKVPRKSLATRNLALHAGLQCSREQNALVHFASGSPLPTE